MSFTTAVHTAIWRPSRLKRVLAGLAWPIVLTLNRPAMSWIGHLLYDTALRLNGLAITFAGRHGLTRAEENFLQRVKLRLQDGVLVDVGANHGAYTRYLAKLAPTARIFAFEPHPATYAVLHASMEGLHGVQPINKAVADITGQLKLYDFRSDDGSTQASLSESAVALYSADLVEHAVDSVTIDAFMLESGTGQIDLLKIDTEGHDLSVLQGASVALREQRIKMIQFEFIPANIATGVTMRRFFEVLRGYRIGRLCLNGAIQWLDVYDVKRCEIYVTHNLIAVPLDQPIQGLA